MYHHGARQQDARLVSMTRFGKTSSQLIIEKGIRHLCHYETGYGSISLGVAADVIEHNLLPDGGELQFSYTLDSRRRNLNQPQFRAYHSRAAEKAGN